ncbi:hypothetical protein CCMA1212_006947 [Trichoderma ghanense]|uniref:Uncharacterized protein n=1 Tax=Trichoderma ghanense TaxID=65468 RepID=A0ABY2GZH2_9HYPO
MDREDTTCAIFHRLQDPATPPTHDNSPSPKRCSYSVPRATQAIYQTQNQPLETASTRVLKPRRLRLGRDPNISLLQTRAPPANQTDKQTNALPRSPQQDASQPIHLRSPVLVHRYNTCIYSIGLWTFWGDMGMGS